MQLEISVAVLERQLMERLRFDEGGVYTVRVSTAFDTSPPLVRGPPQHGLSYNATAPITSDCGAMRLPAHQMALIASDRAQQVTHPMVGTLSIDFDCQPERHDELAAVAIAELCRLRHEPAKPEVVKGQVCPRPRRSLHGTGSKEQCALASRLRGRAGGGLGVTIMSVR